MKRRTICLVVLTGLFAGLFCGSATAAESREDFDKRMEWFRDAKFGLFIHWGAYSTLKGVWKGKPMSGYAEWIQASADIPKEEYEKVAAQFAPDKFDADLWVRTAKQAGMKYLVVTSKHHEGFCLWDSKYTTYDIKDTAGVDRDILGELSAACKKHGLKFGTYYSIIDWHHPSQKPNPEGKGGWKKYGNNVLVNEEAKAEYVAYMKNQLKELVDRYDTQVFWFDGDWNSFWTLEDGKELYAYLRELQPNAIINNRVAKRGQLKLDFGTPEQGVPGSKLDYDWEACWTINHSWGYKEHDKNWKTTKELVQKLADIAGKGGNLLLNVGPTPEGEFPEGCLDRLEGMGKWLAKNGESIYGTRGGPFKTTDIKWGTCTAKGDKLYLHVLSPPENNLVDLPGLKNEIKKAYSLTKPSQKCDVTRENQTSYVDISGVEKDPIDTVIVVEIEGKP